MHTHQRTGAGGLYVDGGAGETEPVGDPGRVEVGVVAHQDLHVGQPVGDVLVRQDVVEQIGLHAVQVVAGAGVDPDPLSVPLVGIAWLFSRACCAHSRNRRCWGSVRRASRALIPKCRASNPAMSSRTAEAPMKSSRRYSSSGTPAAFSSSFVKRVKRSSPLRMMRHRSSGVSAPGSRKAIPTTAMRGSCPPPPISRALRVRRSRHHVIARARPGNGAARAASAGRGTGRWRGRAGRRPPGTGRRTPAAIR